MSLNIQPAADNLFTPADDGDGFPASLNTGNVDLKKRDQDGIPGWWKALFGFNVFARIATGDPDGDGRSNLEEFREGTNPLLSDNAADNVAKSWRVTAGNIAGKCKDLLGNMLAPMTPGLRVMARFDDAAPSEG